MQRTESQDAMYDELRMLEEAFLRGEGSLNLADQLKTAAVRVRTHQGTALPPPGRRAFLNERLRKQLEAMQRQQTDMASCWDARQRKLAERLLRQPADDFLRWSETRSMQSRRHREAHSSLRMLRQNERWSERWSRCVTENETGSAWQLTGEPATSPNSVLLTSHLCRYENVSGLLIDKDFDTILEFGGGYGALCRIIHELGFKGKYIIFDLPVMSALQNYYLSSVGLPVIYPGKLLDAAGSGIACISSPDDLRALLGDSDGNPQTGVLPRSLFIATWSLSETPRSFRNEFQSILSKFSAYLISYALAFEDCDNRDYFHKLIAQAPFSGLSWIEQRLEFQPLNYYLFGFPNKTSSVAPSLLSETLFERAAKRLILWLNWSQV